MSDAALRLQRRYPKARIPRPLMIAIVSVLAAVSLSWLIWTALVHSRPQVVARVSAFTVISDQQIAITMTVDRRNPALPAVCRVVAQATDFQPVAEQQVLVDPADTRLVDVTFTLTTLRRATSPSVKGCTTG